MGLGHDEILRAFYFQLAFHARAAEWASFGVRVRAAGGYSSVEGAIVDLVIAAPSLVLHLREVLSPWAAIELGCHVDGSLAIDYTENRRVGADEISFGLGAGLLVTLELGEVSAVSLDYTVTARGLGGTAVRAEGAATLSYVARFD